MRSRLPIVLSATALVVAVLGATPLAGAAFDALNADKVDGKHAVGARANLNRAAGKLVATRARGASKGKFAKKFIPKVNDADNLDGLDSDAYLDSTIGFASVAGSAATASVRSFGGNGTTSVAVVRNATGDFTVTFTGNYPELASTDSITVLVTMSDTDTFDTASASMDQGSASATQIVVRVFVWSTATTPNPLQDRDFSVAILR